jgi:hypothetical protein
LKETTLKNNRNNRNNRRTRNARRTGRAQPNRPSAHREARPNVNIADAERAAAADMHRRVSSASRYLAAFDCLRSFTSVLEAAVGELDERFPCDAVEHFSRDVWPVVDTLVDLLATEHAKTTAPTCPSPSALTATSAGAARSSPAADGSCQHKHASPNTR